jgi:hypothetical protein
MRAVLTATVPVARFAVFAEMAWLERRPELAALCAVARVSGGKLSAAVVQRALPGLSDAGARNVVDWCRLLGLCDAGGGITRVGEQVVETGEAPVPEQGVFDLWVTNHPLVGARVLHAERLSSNREVRFDQTAPLPLVPDTGVVFRSVVEAARYVLRAIPSSRGEPPAGVVGKTQARCALRWQLDFETGQDRWQLEGALDGGRQGMRPFGHSAESASFDPWRAMDEWATGPLARIGRWQSAARRLAVPFNGLSEAEQDTFEKDVAFTRVEVAGHGAWDEARLEGLPIGPATSEDATVWAFSRLTRRLRSQRAYRSRGEVRRIFADVTEDTPLEPLSPALPPHEEMLRTFAAEPAVFWSLAAPVDLSPAPETDLGAMRVGATSSGQGSHSGGVIRLPYRAGWSMEQLVKRLIDGTSPKRLLLADRYVRGEANLASLRLLVSTLRLSAPTAAVEVWTEEETSLDQVKGITGVPARSYSQIFGRSAPHDRYLLIQGADGSALGWQMSNSPLHARPDGAAPPGPTSPLRWRDLTATRLRREELPEPMSRWFVGASR